MTWEQMIDRKAQAIREAGGDADQFLAYARELKSDGSKAYRGWNERHG